MANAGGVVLITGGGSGMGREAARRFAGQGATVALANKETLVTAGPLVMELAAARGALLLPVDSEHSAIFQALQGGQTSEVQRLVLTASGGPFRTLTPQALQQVTVAEALEHPVWHVRALAARLLGQLGTSEAAASISGRINAARLSQSSSHNSRQRAAHCRQRAYPDPQIGHGTPDPGHGRM